MKEATALGLLFFLQTVNLSLAYIVRSKASLEIGQCLQQVGAKFGYFCPYTHDTRMECLKKIDPADPNDKTELADAIEYEEKRHSACLDENDKKKCIDKEQYNCMVHFTGSLFFKYDADVVCNTIAKARKCLVSLNSTCSHDVIRFDIKELDYVKDQCADGFWDNTPCSPNAIDLCVLPRLSKPCASVVTDYIKSCLDRLKKKCKTHYQQDEIKRKFEYLYETCGTS